MGVIGPLTAILLASAAIAETTNVTPASRVEQVFVEARQQFEQRPDDPRAAWQFGRACFDRADVVAKDAPRAMFAQQGIAACRHAAELDPRCAPAHYYLGLNLGQLARTRTLGALKLLNEMEDTWLRAAELDPQFDFAGAHRSLGMLYRDAPGWPASLGSRSKSRRHLLKAIELSPDYPDNRLAWIEACLEWNDFKSAHAQVEATETVLAQARERLTGDAWRTSWEDWDRRWAMLRTKLGRTPKGESPRVKW